MTPAFAIGLAVQQIRQRLCRSPESIWRSNPRQFLRHEPAGYWRFSGYAYRGAYVRAVCRWVWLP